MDVQTDIKKLTFEFSQEKNLLLRETRGIDFDAVIQAIKQGKILDNFKHKNVKKYPNQKLMIIRIKQYVYAIPYVINKAKGTIFLKTVYPSRDLTKKYL